MRFQVRSGSPKHVRRAYLWAAVAAAILVLFWLALTAVWFEPRSLTVRALAVETPAWRAAPLRVAFLSDVHADHFHMPPARVHDLARRVSELSPDIVILGGDYVGGHFLRSGLPEAARSRRSRNENELDEAGLRALGALRAPLGVFAVLGNHDCWWDCARARDLLRRQGVMVLENRAIEIARSGGSIWLAGIEDGQTQRPDFAKTLASIPEGAAALTIVHNPGLFVWPDNRAAIQLSGHTHAGQVRFPLIGAPVRMSRFTEETADGFMIRDGRILIVTHGVGAVGFPVRFGAAPEIMLLRIAAGPKARVSRI